MSTKHGQFPEKETNLFTITFPRKTLELRNLHIVKALVSRLNETEIIWRGQFCWSAKIKGVLSPWTSSLDRFYPQKINTGQGVIGDALKRSIGHSPPAGFSKHERATDFGFWWSQVLANTLALNFNEQFSVFLAGYAESSRKKGPLCS